MYYPFTSKHGKSSVGIFWRDGSPTVTPDVKYTLGKLGGIANRRERRGRERGIKAKTRSVLITRRWATP